jgi:hypothetical protein
MYSITRYQSGTTWLKHKSVNEGFHIGYFDKSSCYSPYIIRKSRMDIARQNLLSVVAEGLGSVQKNRMIMFVVIFL